MQARALLVTTGLVDELPDVPGLRERWGHDVLHCPYCHGWEVRDQAVGVLATGPMAVHQALLFRQWSDRRRPVHAHRPRADGRRAGEQLAARGISVVPGHVQSLVIDDGRLTGVRLDDGTVVARRALVVAPRFVARADVADLARASRPELEPMGMVASSSPADWSGLTKVPGVWVAGNVTDVEAAGARRPRRAPRSPPSPSTPI